MRTKILTHREFYPSTRLLRDSIEEISGEKILITSDIEKLDYPIIRYGNSNGRFDKDTEFNSPDTIVSMSSKRRFSRILTDNNIFTPIFHFSSDGINKAKFPVLIRTSLTERGGKGIIPVKSQIEFNKIWKNNYCWTEYIELKYELRVHILGGKLVKMFIKKCNEEPDGDIFIRTSKNCNFVLQSFDDKYGKLKEIIDKISEIFGENCFYALDVGWSNSYKKYLVLEGNSAPGLNTQTAKTYAEFLMERLKDEIYRTNSYKKRNRISFKISR